MRIDGAEFKQNQTFEQASIRAAASKRRQIASFVINGGTSYVFGLNSQTKHHFQPLWVNEPFIPKFDCTISQKASKWAAFLASSRGLKASWLLHRRV